MSFKETSSRKPEEAPKLSLAAALNANFDMELRKRPAPAPRLLDHALSLGSCNSEFLSNLLADVSRAKEEIIAQKRAEGKNFQLPSNNANKRRRVSLLNQNRPKPSVKEASPALDLLWEESWLPPPACRQNLVHVVPPEEPEAELTPTVSTSFEGLQSTDNGSSEADLKSSSLSEEGTSRPEEDIFGWFVDMEEEGEDGQDGDLTVRSVDPYKSSSSSSELAFSAWTAPKGSNYDAELEWAKAADTVDDVLGSLF